MIDIALSALVSLLPLAHWWRFRNVPLDRDFAPYSYPARWGTGWNDAGHVDIKPPLIHWSYKLWRLCCKKGTPSQLRLLPAVALSVSVFLMEMEFGPKTAIVSSLLFLLPFSWAHMANTEWLSVLLCAVTLALPWPWALIPLAALPLANQKNVLLVAAYAIYATMALTTQRWGGCIALIAGVAPLAILSLNGKFRHWVFTAPAEFGKRRSWKTHISWKLLIGFGVCAAPFVATIPADRLWLLGLALAFVFGFKQVVPHHMLFLVPVIAVLAQPGPGAFIAFGLAVLASMAWLPYAKPELMYPLTFPGYERMLADMASCEKWVRENTGPAEQIWVNGMENQVYINTDRRAWHMNIPELMERPGGVMPRVIVHCQQSAQPCDYAAYRCAFVSPLQLYAVMVRDEKVLAFSGGVK